MEHLVVSVEQGTTTETYQLLVGVRTDLPERLEYAKIGTLDIDGTIYIAYDATHDTDLTQVLLELMSVSASFDGIQFTRENGINVQIGLNSRPIIAEQSNTSIVYADEYILKIFRRIHHGLSPDLELHRALRTVGCQHIAEPFGAIEGELDGSPVTYGMMSKFFANCADGWAMASASVRDLMAEADLHADEVGGDFAAEAERLGQAVATVHADLASALGTDTIAPENLHDVVAEANHRLDSVLSKVDALAPHADAIRKVYAELAALDEPVVIQRIHGDLHLGQVLRTVSYWALIDFEGEPALPLAKRATKMSPMRDVAGMLRSFDYAAHHLLVDQDSDPQLTYRAQEWIDRNREAFCDGYASAGVDPRRHSVLLRALELEKAVYEVGYEYDNRPSWLDIPLRSISRLIG